MYLEKKYSNLFFTLNENIKYPFFILDKEGNIISSNSEANTLFLIPNGLNSFYKIFNEATVARLRRLISEVQAVDKPVNESLLLTLNSGKQYKTIVKMTSFIEADEYLIFCSIMVEENKASVNEPTSITVNSGDIKNSIADSAVLNVINEIKSLYPFTFLGKEKVRRQVNRLNELFWIKDVDDNYMLVNNKLADNLGVNVTQLEGKKESSFVSPHQLNFIKAIESYIKESSNSVIIEGLPFKGNLIKDTRIIEIPLKDADNNILAIIGFTQKSEKNLNLIISSGVLENIPVALAVIKCSGSIENATSELKKYLSVKTEITGKNYEEVFPENIAKKIGNFLNSSLSNDEADIEELHAKIFFNKVYGKENDAEGISLFIKEDENYYLKQTAISWSSNMTDQLLEKSPEPVIIYNRDSLKFLNVNEAALSLYGYSRDEFLKLDLTDLYEPENIQSLLYANDASKEGEFSRPIVQKMKGGKKILVEVSKININYNGQSACYSIIKNVTDENELKQKNQLFKSAFDNTNDFIFITDSSGFIAFSNKSVNEVLGYSKDELANSAFVSIVKDEERGRINSAVFQSETKGETSLKTELKKKNSDLVEAEIIFTPVLDINSVVQQYSVLGKIIKENVEKPEEKPGGVVISKEINQEYLSNIFHEILTPINVILGFVQELTDSIGNMSTDQKESVNIIDQNRKNLLNIMNSVVEYSTLQTENKLEVSEISVTRMLDDLQKELAKSILSTNTEFAYGRISSSLKFQSDPEKFVHLVVLLFSIISRLSKEKKLYFSAYQFDDENFIVSFRDNYSFVSDSLTKKISALLKDDNKIKEYGVSRLSLILSKELLSVLKGNYQIIKSGSQVKDCGFIFPLKLGAVQDKETSEILPDFLEADESAVEEEIDYKTELNAFKPAVDPNRAAETEVLTEEKKEKEEKLKPELSKLNCLYIEDQVDSQILFKVQMKDLNEVKFAIDFEDALPLLDENKFDFIVMDINLPGDYNGLDALRIIRKIPSYETIPVIAVTAYLLPGNKDKFISAGFTDFIEKPLFRDKIIKTLEKIF